MAWGSHDPAGDRDYRSDRPRIWPRRATAPARASLLVPVLRRGDGDGLAFLRHHDERARRLRPGSFVIPRARVARGRTSRHENPDDGQPAIPTPDARWGKLSATYS